MAKLRHKSFVTKSAVAMPNVNGNTTRWITHLAEEDKTGSSQCGGKSLMSVCRICWVGGSALVFVRTACLLSDTPNNRTPRSGSNSHRRFVIIIAMTLCVGSLVKRRAIH